MNYSITIEGEQLPILIRKRRGARRMVIRYQPLKHAISLTLPYYTSVRNGLRFAEDKRSWIARRIAEAPKLVPFEDGQVIPFLGQDHVLRHAGGRGVVRIEAGEIIVSGEKSFMARRVREFIKRRVREEIMQLAGSKARQIGVRINRISLRDTSSRWGSCSHDGNLSFSWRLAFAPYAVLEYLVSHEVAHIKQHNHSPAFWTLVAQLCPAFEQPERWLKLHGPGLYRYG